MYGIYGNIYHHYTPNVSIYTSTMDPMGKMIPFDLTLRRIAKIIPLDFPSSSPVQVIYIDPAWGDRSLKKVLILSGSINIGEWTPKITKIWRLPRVLVRQFYRRNLLGRMNIPMFVKGTPTSQGDNCSSSTPKLLGYSTCWWNFNLLEVQSWFFSG